MYVLIISLTQTDGFGVSLVYCKRRPWFTEKAPTLSEKGNIMVRYRKISVAQIRRKFIEAETLRKSLFNARLHQPSEYGGYEALPLFAPLFFKYFDYCQTRDLVVTMARVARRIHLRVNYSIIRQQA